MKLHYALLFIPSLCMANNQTDIINYSNVYEAKTGVVNELLVRYVRTFDSPCAHIQVLKPGSEGEIINDKKICTLKGKSFLNDYAEVDIRGIEMDSSGVILKISFTPLTPIGEQIKKCFVSFIDDKPQDLECLTSPNDQ